MKNIISYIIASLCYKPKSQTLNGCPIITKWKCNTSTMPGLHVVELLIDGDLLRLLLPAYSMAMHEYLCI